ncbi:unnamed protein product [Candida verbasci]|uniref:Shugoshin N-terminal coiled-coil domain-containing protein n=1 Tax=Candida verbasci TaxID=1227364 RepID=A0A9W4X8V4_9ASCO|nr:unnamed protein product [Candida verbasci]
MARKSDIPSNNRRISFYSSSGSDNNDQLTTYKEQNRILAKRILNYCTKIAELESKNQELVNENRMLKLRKVKDKCDGQLIGIIENEFNNMISKLKNMNNGNNEEMKDDNTKLNDNRGHISTIMEQEDSDNHLKNGDLPLTIENSNLNRKSNTNTTDHDQTMSTGNIDEMNATSTPSKHSDKSENENTTTSKPIQFFEENDQPTNNVNFGSKPQALSSPRLNHVEKHLLLGNKEKSVSVEPAPQSQLLSNPYSNIISKSKSKKTSRRSTIDNTTQEREPKDVNKSQKEFRFIFEEPQPAKSEEIKLKPKPIKPKETKALKSKTKNTEQVESKPKPTPLAVFQDYESSVSASPSLSDENNIGRRSTRIKKEVSYKQPSMRAKMRRESVKMLDAVGENVFLNYTNDQNKKRKDISPIKPTSSSKRKPLGNITTNTNSKNQKRQTLEPFIDNKKNNDMSIFDFQPETNKDNTRNRNRRYTNL